MTQNNNNTMTFLPQRFGPLEDNALTPFLKFSGTNIILTINEYIIGAISLTSLSSYLVSLFQSI